MNPIIHHLPSVIIVVITVTKKMKVTESTDGGTLDWDIPAVLVLTIL